MTRPNRLGSVSSGTLRPRDLLRAFSDALKDIDGGRRYASLIREARTVYANSQRARDVLDDLEHALGEYAPAYCYFGVHPGDGADFGYWPDWRAIELDRRDGTLSSGDDLPADGSSVGQYLHISDHGNAELYAWDSANHRWQSVWAVV